MPVPAGMLKSQLDTLLSDIRPEAAKTGMLSTAANVELVAAKVREYGLTTLVVDPVMLATSGASLLEPDAQLVFRKKLLPLALLITPNLDEARTHRKADRHARRYGRSRTSCSRYGGSERPGKRRPS